MTVQVIGTVQEDYRGNDPGGGGGGIVFPGA